LDLFGKTSIADTFDVCTIGDLFFGEVCFLTPTIADAMGKPYICMFSKRASVSNQWTRLITPQRLFHRKDLGVAIYDE
jgi:hypothetical protein